MSALASNDLLGTCNFSFGSLFFSSHSTNNSAALPDYAPELNPWDVGGWHHLKNVEMGNLTCLDLEDLHLELHLAIGRLRRKPRPVTPIYKAAGLTI